MDRQAFIDETFDFGINDDDAFDRAIKNAERVIGITVEALVNGALEQDWMINVCRRNFLNWIIKQNLLKHSFGNAALQQRFENPMEYLAVLEKEWAGMKKEIQNAETISGGAFEVFGPGFAYDNVGRPYVNIG